VEGPVTRKQARDGEPRPPWCSGSARFEPGLRVEGHPLVVAVRCRFGSFPADVRALLDTGAQWSVVGGDLAEELRQDAEEEAHEVTLTTRLGVIRGHLFRMRVTLVADHGGDLHVQSSVVLDPKWSGPLVLGYGGFLERIRIGLDPGSAPGDDPWLFFGSDH
jgi:hypothetical protein